MDGFDREGAHHAEYRILLRRIDTEEKHPLSDGRFPREEAMKIADAINDMLCVPESKRKVLAYRRWKKMNS